MSNEAEVFLVLVAKYAKNNALLTPHVQEPRLENGKCEQCGFEAPTRCSYNRHVQLHRYDPSYKERIETGLICRRCKRRVRVSKLAVHNYFVHNVVCGLVFQVKRPLTS
jgi:hypothetical protein